MATNYSNNTTGQSGASASNNFSGGYQNQFTNTTNFGNFDFGQSRMAGDAFSADTSEDRSAQKAANDQFVYNQQEFVQNQQTQDQEKLGETITTEVGDWSPTWQDTVEGGTGTQPIITQPGGNVTNNYNSTSTSEENTTITNTVDIDQKIDQESDASYEFGDISFEHSFNNNQLGDFAEMNVYNNQYGGDVKSINIAYNGEGAQMKATPISDLTAAGAYEVSDSPAATAGFIGKYTDLNRANQFSYGNTGIRTASKYIDLGRANKAIDTEAMDRRTSSSPLYHESKSRVEGAYTFGDRYAESAPDWDPVQNQDPDTNLNPDLTEGIFNPEDEDED